ncbi:hypothetical protein FGADI_12338 [Fusarium gaditjirri]|uniref:Uncharacterized protein n=1 Tax=Fusarium gaditjirri TaxID=282569 RepID=A0A8H4SSL1_9HYPO|nr:hypothetical protein FGADI_12338 [Fusarium gaditjirri]
MTTRDWSAALALILHFALLKLSPSQTNTEHRDMPRIMEEELLARCPYFPLRITDARDGSLAKYLMEFTARYSMSGLVTAASSGTENLPRWRMLPDFDAHS